MLYLLGGELKLSVLLAHLFSICLELPIFVFHILITGGSQGRVQGVRTPPPLRDDLRFSNTTGILQKRTMWFTGVEVEQETSAPPPKKHPGSAPAYILIYTLFLLVF